MPFNTVLRDLRTRHNLTQKMLGNALGLSESTIGMYERGQREPDFETLEAIADYFNVDMNYLTGRSDVSNTRGSLPVIEDVYLSFARRAQDEGIEPEDIQLAIETIRKLRGKRNNNA